MIFLVQDVLIRLLKSLGPDIELIASKTTPGHFDYHNELLSMPLAFKTNLKNVPAKVPYLQAEPNLIQKWKSRIGTEGFKIGISWQGDKNKRIDVGRSFPVGCFEPLARIPNIRLISLQKNAGVEQLCDLPAAMKVETLGDDFDAGSDAFIDAAAVMENLDLIITSDTALAHLAGALARPTWAALKCSWPTGAGWLNDPIAPGIPR